MQGIIDGLGLEGVDFGDISFRLTEPSPADEPEPEPQPEPE
eukprot:COSAG04_NODE_5245_length_1688_cov_1.649465_1_plen_40_part_10